MRNEFTKRLKGLMALVLCFGMLFGNGLTVFAAETHAVSLIQRGDSINADDFITGSGSLKITYKWNGNTESVEFTLSSTSSYRVADKWGIRNWTVQSILLTDDSSSWVMVLTNGSALSEERNGGAGHEHTFEWDMTKVPTRTEDGEASYICKICGYVAATQPATRWQWFMKQYRDLVKNAEHNATITFEADDMPCISDYMLGFNIDRPDVTTIVHFTYEGVNYELTIPAGTDFSAIQSDTDTFYGYFGLAAKLGLTAKVVE